MPQLIAMVIVVVGAMIYMFQTFGGTGDKIEGVAQKASIITEINNIKDGIKIAAKSRHIGNGTTDPTDAVTQLEGLAELSYFAEQINNQILNSASNTANADNYNIYKAISFGGDETARDGAMELSMVSDAEGYIPGIFVDLSKGSLKDNTAFLEAQIATDLSSISFIDRTAKTATVGTIAARNTAATATELEERTPADNGEAGTNSDGQFIIYFKDFGSDEVVQ